VLASAIVLGSSNVGWRLAAPSGGMVGGIGWEPVGGQEGRGGVDMAGSLRRLGEQLVVGRAHADEHADADRISTGAEHKSVVERWSSLVTARSTGGNDRGARRGGVGQRWRSVDSGLEGK
jgi:hypothetical protein